MSKYRYISISIPANDIAERSVYGRFLTLLDNSALSDVEVSIAGDAFEALPAGISVEINDQEQSFTNLRFKNPTASVMAIKIALSSGRVLDNRLVASAELDVSITGNDVESPAAVTVTDAGVVLAAVDTIRERWLQNNGGSDVWIGDANVDPANKRGYKIVPNSGFVVAGNCAFTVKTPAGTTSTLSILNMKRV